MRRKVVLCDRKRVHSAKNLKAICILRGQRLRFLFLKDNRNSEKRLTRNRNQRWLADLPKKSFLFLDLSNKKFIQSHFKMYFSGKASYNCHRFNHFGILHLKTFRMKEKSLVQENGSAMLIGAERYF